MCCTFISLVLWARPLPGVAVGWPTRLSFPVVSVRYHVCYDNAPAHKNCTKNTLTSCDIVLPYSSCTDKTWHGAVLYRNEAFILQITLMKFTPHYESTTGLLNYTLVYQEVHNGCTCIENWSTTIYAFHYCQTGVTGLASGVRVRALSKHIDPITLTLAYMHIKNWVQCT